MSVRRPAWIFASLLSARGGQETKEEESASYPEPCHLRQPVDEAMMAWVEGIRACFDAWKERSSLTGEYRTQVQCE